MATTRGWLGAGVVTAGVGIALASGSAVAHADSASTGHAAGVSSKHSVATSKRSASVPAVSVSSARATNRTAPADPVVGLLAGALSVLGLNRAAAPADPVGAAAWRLFRSIETAAGLVPKAGTPIISTHDSTTGVVTGTLGFTEPAGLPLTYTVSAAPTLGSVTVSSTGIYTYTPTSSADEAPATDTFTVTATDGLAATTETVTVPVGPTITVLSDQFGVTTIGGKYVVQNNAYNNSAGQTIVVTASGFTITVENGSAATPLAYPSVYLGCAFGTCSPSSPLPEQLGHIQSVTTSITTNDVATGTYDSAYDIFLDSTPRTDGQNQQEIMVWLKQQGSIVPIGSPVATTTINGLNWQVWQGYNGDMNVVTYVASVPTNTLTDFNVLNFIDDTEARTAQTSNPVTDDWYLTSVQAGFETWQGGVGLGVDSFSATVT